MTTMTGDEFLARLRGLGINQRRFAVLTGITFNTASRWRTGQSAVPLWAVRLLDAWATTGVPTDPVSLPPAA